MKKVLYAKYNRTRNPRFQTSTRIVMQDNERFVEKTALTDEAVDYIQSFRSKYDINMRLYKNITPLKGTIEGGTITFPYVTGSSFKEKLEAHKYSLKELCDDIRKCFDVILQYNDDMVCDFVITDEFKEVFGMPGNGQWKALKACDIDIIFDNIILCDGQWTSVDYEWTFDFPIPMDFVKYRMLYRYYYSESMYFNNVIGVKDFIGLFDIDKYSIDMFDKMEYSFQCYVYGENLKYQYPNRYAKKGTEFISLHEKYGDIGEALESRDRIVSEQAGRIEILDRENEAYKNSLSWKITKPLRFAGDKMHALKVSVSRIRLFEMVLNIPACISQNGWKYSIKYAGHVLRNGVSNNQRISLNRILDKDDIMRQREVQFDNNIIFSILVPLYNTPDEFLGEMIESVCEQTYGGWELCLADGSDEAHGNVEKLCREYQSKDSRIKYRKLENNRGISENTNACIEMATGDYICLFDHDDVLHPGVLFECMKVIEDSAADYIYTDEMTFVDTLDNIVNVHYKPDYSPDTLRSYNYICHFSVFKRELLDKVGYFNSEFDGSQDYDIILRLTECADNIVHIPKVLYFWRAHKNSVAQNITAKPYTLEAAKKVLQNHLDRVGLEGEVKDTRVPSVYKIDYKLKGMPKISILIPNKDHICELEVCLKSIFEKSTYSNYEIIIIENNSVEEETFRYYENISREHTEVKVVYWKGEFNFSAINNYGFKCSTGDYILLLNNDIEVISENWLEEMLMFAQRDDVGAVGAMLYYPDDTVQHAGVILGIGGVAGHSHKNYQRGAYGYSSRLALAQNLSAVTAACMMMRRNVFEEVHGLDDGFRVAFNDVDLCMRIRRQGYLIVFTPFAELYHYESKSRGLEDTAEKQMRFKGETERFMERWENELQKGDPYYNPNLTLYSEDFSFADR